MRLRGHGADRHSDSRRKPMMDHFQKTVTKTGYGEARINKTKKILLIGGAKSDALSNRQQTHRLFHCDSVLQAWDLVYRYPPEVIVLNLDNSDGTALSFAGMPGVSGTRPDHRGGPGSPDTASHEGAGIPRLGGDSDRHRYWKASVRSSKAWGCCPSDRARSGASIRDQRKD